MGRLGELRWAAAKSFQGGDGTFAVQEIRSLLRLGCATVASGTLGGQREGAALARGGKGFGDHAIEGATTRGVDRRQLYPWHEAL